MFPFWGAQVTWKGLFHPKFCLEWEGQTAVLPSCSRHGTAQWVSPPSHQTWVCSCPQSPLPPPTLWLPEGCLAAVQINCFSASTGEPLIYHKAALD